jgi:hypothetical protein
VRRPDAHTACQGHIPNISVQSVANYVNALGNGWPTFTPLGVAPVNPGFPTKSGHPGYNRQVITDTPKALHKRGAFKHIANQELHHRTESFQDEFRRLLRKYAIEYDERYVWD